MQPEARGETPDATRPRERTGREQATVVGLALLSALFFTGALAYGLGSGLLTGGSDGDRDADRDGRPLPREWASLIPLRPLDPELDRDDDTSQTAGAREDSTGSDAPAGPSARPERVVPAGARPTEPRVRPAVVLSLPQRTPILRRVVSPRLTDLVDLTRSRPDLPQLPDTGDVDPGLDIDVLPGGVRIPPIGPFPGVRIPPIGPFPGLQTPTIDPFPGGVVSPPIDPTPGGGLPLPGAGLPRPGGPLGTLPPPVLISIASLEPLDAIVRRREAEDVDRTTDAPPTTLRSTVAAERGGDRAGDESRRANRRAARQSADRAVEVARTSTGSRRADPGLRQPKRKGSRSPAPSTKAPQPHGSDRCPTRPRQGQDREGAERACGDGLEADDPTNAPTDPDDARQEARDPGARPDPAEEDDA